MTCGCSCAVGQTIFCVYWSKIFRSGTSAEQKKKGKWSDAFDTGILPGIGLVALGRQATDIPTLTAWLEAPTPSDKRQVKRRKEGLWFVLAFVVGVSGELYGWLRIQLNQMSVRLVCRRLGQNVFG